MAELDRCVEAEIVELERQKVLERLDAAMAVARRPSTRGRRG